MRPRKQSSTIVIRFETRTGGDKCKRQLNISFFSKLLGICGAGVRGRQAGILRMVEGFAGGIGTLVQVSVTCFVDRYCSSVLVIGITTLIKTRCESLS